MFVLKYGEYLCICRLGDLPEVILRSGGDSLKENLLCHSTPQHHAHPVKQLLTVEQVLFLRQILHITQTFSSGNNGDLREYMIVTPIINIIMW